MNKIVLTGAESTGKTDVAIKLSKHFRGEYVPEYARTYVENLENRYTFADVDHIAQKQVQLLNETKSTKYLFVDTYLIIIKVWFEEVFGDCPEWVDKKLKENDVDLFLVCAPDIPWVEDSVRENGGGRRIELHERYIKELIAYNKNFEVISGDFNTRSKLAIEIVKSYF